MYPTSHFYFTTSAPQPQVPASAVAAKWRYCTICNIMRPAQAKHCSACQNCVDGFDHHCPYTSNCVGTIVLFCAILRYEYLYLYILHIILCISAPDFS